MLVSSLQCYSNILDNSNLENKTRTNSSAIKTRNCTAFSEENQRLLDNWQLPEMNQFNLNLLGCFTNFNLCRVFYTVEGPEMGCSCEREWGYSAYLESNNSCKDMSSFESFQYNTGLRNRNEEINRIISFSRNLPGDPKRMTWGRHVGVARICGGILARLDAPLICSA